MTWPPVTRCARCRDVMTAWTMSYFNMDVICLPCSEREQAHPDYERARRTETEACRRGDYNYPGIGLPADLAR